MIEDDLRVAPATWQSDCAALCAVREQVFVVEQQVPIEDERDAFDARSHHVLARDRHGQPIGTGRLVPPHVLGADDDDRAPTAAVIGRMAVLAAWRGRGVGAAILRVLLEQARTLGYAVIELHAQTHALAFYAKSGFVPHGAEFDECGIAHRGMSLALAAPVAREQPPLPPRPAARALIAADRRQAVAAIAMLLDDARHDVALYTRDLDAPLLDVPQTLDALKRIALSGRHARLRILAQDVKRPLASGHRLIALAQRLPSAIALRTPVDERDLQYPSAFLLNDRGGYLFRLLGTRAEGEGSTCAPGRHAQLREYFDQVWERSLPSAELRTLGF